MELNQHKYVDCYRCGIIMGLWYETHTVFCADCDHPDLLGVFRPTSFQWLFEGDK